MHWEQLVLWMLLCFAVSGVGGLVTAREIAGWYSTLARPAIAPPNWVFGPVWTLLYALMAIAAWRISILPSSVSRMMALTLFSVQLGLNLAWSFFFFHWHKIGLALIEIFLLWGTILLTALAFLKISAVAFWLMVPYLAWVTFAAILNAAFWRLNKGPGGHHSENRVIR